MVDLMGFFFMAKTRYLLISICSDREENWSDCSNNG